MITKTFLGCFVLLIPFTVVCQTHTNASIENDVYVNYNTYSSGSTGDGLGNLILFGDGSNGAGWQSSIKWSGRDGFSGSTSSGTRVNAEISIDNVGTYGKADLVLKTKGSNDDTTPTEKMRISQNGDVGIGTTNPLSKLHIYNGASGHNPHGYSDFSVEDDDHVMMTLMTTNSKYGYYGFADSEDDFVGGLQYNHASDMMYFRVNNRSADMVINEHGDVGIGTTSPDSKLAVNGNIHAKEVKVDLTGWPDYILIEDYDLPTLDEVEKHIQEKGHLINIPSAKEVEEDGIQLGKMNKLLLEKIEELTLYTLQQQKILVLQKEKNKSLEERLLKLEKKLTNNKK